MNWEDECYLLSKVKFRENANIINVFSSERGRVSGVVYGGNSRKIRNYLQISNKLFIIHNSKNENKIGYFKTELVNPISPKYFSDKERTTALISLCSILNVLLPEGQPNKNIYKSFDNLINSLGLDNWIIMYIFFELNLIKELGYDTNLNQFLDQNTLTSELRKIKVDGNIFDIPTYLITKELPAEINLNLIRKSLYFTRSIIMKRFFQPHNLIFPKSRVILENYYN